MTTKTKKSKCVSRTSKNNMRIWCIVKFNKNRKKTICIFCWPFSSSLSRYSFQFMLNMLNMLNWCSRWYNMTAFDDFFARSRSICRCIYYLRAKWLFAQTCILIMLFEQCFKYILHDLLKTLAESLQINMYMCTCVHCTVYI